MTIPRLMILGLLLLAGVMTCCTGCSQSVPQKKKFSLTNPFTKDRPQRAARMTCFWEPKILAEKQGVIRGFQGEIIFFRDDKMQDSVMVDGELTVYVYDADDRRTVNLGGVEGIKPLCEYRFDSETLAKGFAKNKKTKMISYGIWLPIDKMPGDEKHLVLWAKYEGSGKHGELLGTDTSDQITVYLPGNPVEKKKQEQPSAAASYSGIRQAVYDDINDFSNAQQSAYVEAVTALQNGNRNPQSEGRHGSDAIPMSPGLARQLFNAHQQERDAPNETATSTPRTTSTGTNNNRSTGIGFGSGDTPMPSRNTTVQSGNQVSVGFGNGNTIPGSTMHDGTSPQFLARNRLDDITSIGAQFDQRMQNGQSPQGLASQVGYINIDGPDHNNLQQASWIAQNPSNNTGTTGRAENHQMMTEIMAEHEQRRRFQDQPVNPQSFTDYNANSFATDQNRFTAQPDRYESWGVPTQGYQQYPSPGQQQDYFLPNRYPVQNPGTSQPAYTPSDWGPGLEQLPSDRQTQVLYSSSADRIYR